MLANVITGVALLKADDEISFYFGCVAQATGMGGAGLFVGSFDDASVRSVYKLRDNDSAAGEVRAGTMFSAESVMCDVEEVWLGMIASFAVCLVSLHWSALVVTSLLLLAMSVMFY